jgi:hypothetical protein
MSMTAQANADNHPGVAAIKQIIDRCDAQIAAGRTHVYIDVGSRSNLGERVRLTPVSGPVGEVACVNVGGSVIGIFDPEKVSAFLRKGAREVGVIL